MGESQCVYRVEGHTYGTADAVAKKVPEMDMSKKGFRLPTEAEWEWAAMGGKDYKWSGTNVESELKDYAWYGGDKTHEVKKKTANGYGSYDMSGNVWEWCWDRYGNISNTTPNTGSASGSSRCRRGSSWYEGAFVARVADRNFGDPNFRYNVYGFRLVRNAD